MMHMIKARNVNGALSEGMLLLGSSYKSVEVGSRNGPVRRAKGPVLIETRKPMERVLFSGLRKANPFFHLFESLWMLAGRNDLPWLAQFNKQMATYSDDGGLTQPAAYGHRWREYFGYDQLDLVVDQLTRDPGTRRAVITMWNAGGERDNSILVNTGDMVAAINGSKDVPCNTQIYLQLEQTSDGTQLNMTVTCRSNDALWGAHGANAVHFSVLLEYLAARLTVSLGHRVAVGRMYQFANDYHYYTDILKCSPEGLAIDAADCDYYGRGRVEASPIFPEVVTDHFFQLFNRDLEDFVAYADPRRNPLKGSGGGRRELKTPELKTTWFNEVALPMLRTWDAHKQGDTANIVQLAHKVKAEDWGLAAVEWMTRRKDNVK